MTNLRAFQVLYSPAGAEGGVNVIVALESDAPTDVAKSQAAQCIRERFPGAMILRVDEMNMAVLIVKATDQLTKS